jgi:hypothetical protein
MMVYAMVLVITAAFSITAPAGVLIDNADQAKYCSPWKTVKYEFYQFNMNYSGGGTINLNNKFVLFPIVPALYFNVPVYDANHKKTERMKAEAAANTWEKIDGSVLDEENGGKTLNMTATSGIGIKNTVTVETGAAFAVSQSKVEAIDAPAATAFRYDTAILNYGKLSSIPFTATLESGETVSGDLCQDFKPVKNIRTLTLMVDHKTFKIEFEGLGVTITPRNSPTVAAGINMSPVIKGGTLMPGGSFSYKIKVTIAGDAMGAN